MSLRKTGKKSSRLYNTKMENKKTNRALLSLGSNLGDREDNIYRCIKELGKIPGIKVIQESSLIETVPVGPAQPNFINSAILVETLLLPDKLLQEALRIEKVFGRVRTFKWGRRIIDVDMILFGNMVVKTPSLEIPQPLFRVREFVLAPAAEIAPNMVDPISGHTIEYLLKKLSGSANSSETS